MNLLLCPSLTLPYWSRPFLLFTEHLFAAATTPLDSQKITGFSLPSFNTTTLAMSLAQVDMVL
jgi:hypothetical protein